MMLEPKPVIISRIPSRQSGFMVLIVPIIVVALILMGAKMIERSRTGMKMASINMDYLQVELCTQQCASLAVNASSVALNNWKSISSESESCTCKTEKGMPVQTCERTIGNVVEKQEVGCYGVKYMTTSVPVTSTCKDASGQSASLVEEADLHELPIFQFAVFYENYLEVQPGANLTMNGRIHANDTIELSPGSGLFLNDWMTTPSILGIQKDNGRTYFGMKDLSGPDKSAVSESKQFTLLDQNIGSSKWTDWKKKHLVAYANQGNDCPAPQELAIPFTRVTDYHVVIDWRDSTNDDDNLKKVKYAWNANLILKNGTWFNNDMSPANLSKDPRILPPGFKISPFVPDRVTFWEARDQMMLQLVPLDLEILQQRSGDGVIYLHDILLDPTLGNRHVGGFLLYNCAKLTRPLTISTSTRLVVYGDYNTSKNYLQPSGSLSVYPSSLVSDCMIHLSTLFNFDEHTFTNHPGTGEFGNPMPKLKPPYRLIMNSSVMTGMKNNNGSQNGQGGVNNLVRGLENWNGNEYEKNGSMVCLWYSKDSYGKYRGFDPPTRIWSFDPLYDDIRNMPPATPRLVNPMLASWQFIRK